MSQEDVNNGGAEDQSQDRNQGEDKSSEAVSVKAYQEVKSDMFKYKEQKKEAEMELNRLRAELKSKEEEQLLKEKKYEELWRKEQEEKEKLEQNLKANNDLYLKAVKKSHLKSELGSNVKDVYLDFADIDSIEIDDNGIPSSESILAVANKFRKEYPELVGSSENANITDNAPGNNRPTDERVDLSNASKDEIRSALRNAPVGGKRFNNQ